MFGGLKPRISVLLVAAGATFAQSPATRPAFSDFEVATVKPTAPDWQGGAYFTMQGGHRFIVQNYTLKALIGAAWNLNPRLISGGPTWAGSDHYDVVAGTPGELSPDTDEQMSMLRTLLANRFKLTFHREQKELSIYALTVANGGPKIKQSDALPSGVRQALVFRLFPERRALLPARDATMAEFASVLQRGPLDRPVVNKTGLAGRYDFSLDWAPDESAFGGLIAGRQPLPDDAAEPDLFTAVQQQLGLKLEATRGPVVTFVIDQAERPSEN
jgi:uncharacterized protein (TIGR03435 family)